MTDAKGRRTWWTRGNLRTIRYALIFPLSVLLLFLAILFWFASAPPLIVLNARATYLVYEVTSQELALLAVRNAVVILDGDDVVTDAKDGGDPSSDSCFFLYQNQRFTGLIRASTGTHVEYISLADGLLVSFDAQDGVPHIEIARDGRPTCKIDARLSLIVQGDDLRKMAPLPIVGRVEIGSETVETAPPVEGELLVKLDEPDLTVELPAAHMLYEASAQVFSRTSKIWDDGRLIPIESGSFNIPRGSRLASINEVGFGNAVYEPEAHKLQIEITLNSDELLIYRSGSQRTDESFAIGAMARAFGDPTLAPLLIAFVVAGFLLQIFFAIEGMYRERKDL